MKYAALGTLAVVAVALAVARPACAQNVEPRQQPSAAAAPTIVDSTLDARTAAVASTLRCPVCQGESIEASPSELAAQMRAVVRDRLRAGETPDAIRAYFVSKYGEWILLEPKMTGLNILLYVLPVLLVVGGVVLVVVLVRRWTTPKTSTQ
jgi:cytochrome c-type biogenesis protein CcmH